MKDNYDIVVVGSGLGGMTCANRLARAGHRVLLVEQHSQLGGLATWFRRKSHIFDVALHGFPVGMRKSLRKYWGKPFAERVIQVQSIRFQNPQYRLESTFDTQDFSAKLTGHFGIPQPTVQAFFSTLAAMNYYDRNEETTGQLFQRFFPDRTDVWRFLMEPITYANGSTLNEPAISYGIVFGNFMSEGVYTFSGGTDLMLKMMADELAANGVELEKNARAEHINVEQGRVRSVLVNGHEIACRAVVFNGSLPRLIHEVVGDGQFRPEFLAGLNQVRLSTSSCQVYIGVKPGEKLPWIGDLIFSSEYPCFDSDALCSRKVTSRTYSVYYPGIRPGTDKYSIVASMNARYEDWAAMSKEEYQTAKKAMIEETLDALASELVPDIRSLTDYTEAATPLTFQRYTGHQNGATFGTKFEGLPYSMNLNQELPGLFHTGSVGIIMSGWLGAVNYGVIVANEVDRYLNQKA
ncbi:MAG: NAD(P)/FAD-dependent oxidoreductase [Victivallales bacterium]|nr:NAD(P)/FAD-dependent oxidoreductase [Victivallales bacterium]